MIPVGYYVMLNDSEHDHFQVLRVVERLTKRLYLAARVCPNHEDEPHDIPGMVVFDVKVLAEYHVEWGPRGMIFATYEELRELLAASFDDDDDDAVEAAPPAAVH